MHQPPYQPPAPPRPPRWGRFAAWTGAAAVAAFAIGGGLAVWLDDDTTPNPSSCKTALTANFRTATEATAAGRSSSPMPAPPECLGLDRVTLERITGEVVADYLESPEADKAAEDMLRRAMESAAATP